MQERYIFREMLSEIKGLADQKGNRLSLDEIREFFKNAHLTEEQLQMVCAYLNEEKIQIEGYEGAGKQEAPDKEEAGMMEESDCLELYQAELEEIEELSEEEELKCFQLASAGDPAAKSRLTEHYLRTVYDLSRTFAFGSVPRSDLIQEGNVALVLALEELGECIPSGDNVEQQVQAAELGKVLEAFLQTLPEERRRMFLMRYWYLAPIREIAQRLGWTEGRVRTALHRIRKQLLVYLQERGMLDEA